MLTPEQLKEIPESFVSQIQELEDYIIADIARRIGKEGRLTDTAIMQLNKVLALGADINEIEQTIRKVTGAALNDIDRVIREAISESVNADNAIYKSAGYNPIEFQNSPELMELLEAGIRQTKGEFMNLTASMGFASMVGGKVHFQTIASFYQNAMNMAAMQVSTGVLDLDSAVRYAVKKMADSGIRYVDYASGHVNRVDVAVRRAITSGINQLNLRLTDKIIGELEAEYVEVTAHAGARPDHKIWQGKVYHVGGSKDGYPDFVSSTGYGTGSGLGGWNCRHGHFPFFPGISVRAYTDEQLKNIDNPPFTYEGKRYTHYEATQRQRELETAMRKTKREIIAYDAAGLKNDFTAASIRLNMQKEAYKAFSEAAGLPMQLIRAEQYGFGKSISQKAVWARRKEIEKYSKFHYNKDGSIVVTDDWKDKGHVSVPMKYKPFAVIETKKEYKSGGGQVDRTLYGANGMKLIELHSSHHNRPTKHPYGNNGEHSHLYKFNENNTFVVNRDVRELKNIEREWIKDLL